MNISLILCTYNRSQQLRRTLESIARSVFATPTRWEVLLVDNNSNDGTREVIDDCIRRFPGRFLYLFEPVQGRSHALNRGISEAAGDILAFTDDDVEVTPEWLDHLTRPLRSGECMGVSGRTLPPRPFVAPRWLPTGRYYGEAPLALFDRGLEPLDMHEAPYGNNMAFRKGMFTRYGGFRVDLGRSPGAMLGSEDSEFGSRLLRGGERMRYEPQAVLFHDIPSNRLTKDYFLRWWHDKTRSDVRAFGLDCDQDFRIRGIPLSLFRRYCHWACEWLLSPTPQARFAARIRMQIVRGAMRERLEPTTVLNREKRPKAQPL